MMLTTDELDDIQCNILRGYRFHETLPHVAYYFLRLGTSRRTTWRAAQRAARAFFREAHEHTTSCLVFDRIVSELSRDRFVWNIGLTYDGVGVLSPQSVGNGEGPYPFGVFTPHPAFAHGARQPARATAIGDVGESAPDKWESVYRTDGLHAMISVSAWYPEGIDAARSRLDELLRRHRAGVRLVQVETGNALDGGKEHFGYVDGIGQPAVEGSGLRAYPGEGTPTNKGWTSIPAGDFVIGYPTSIDNSGHCEVEDDRRLKLLTPPLLFRGSFFVFRKLKEDAAAFRTWVRKQSRECGVEEELFAAKLVGRWRNGAPLALYPEKDEPNFLSHREKVNDFRYLDDVDGFKTPFGSHIRRANPRDDPTGPTPNQTAVRRIIRRATPYGPPLEGEADDGVERGVLFGVINADIYQQFEFVQANWINSTVSSSRLTLDADKDPLIGANETGNGKFTIPTPEGPKFVWDLPRFVTVKGAAYFFMPGIRALRNLVSQD